MVARRRLILLVVLVCAFAVLMLARQPGPTASEPAPQRPVVLLADGAIAAGAVIGAADYRKARWDDPSAAPPKSALAADAIEIAATPHYALADIEPGALLTLRNVSGDDQARPVAFSLRPGRRAISVSSGALAGGDRQVIAGSVVDVFLLASSGDGQASAVYPLATAIPVLAAAREGADGRTYTLDVDIDAAKRIALAQNLGKLTLLERGRDEDGDEVGLTTPITADDLFGIDPVVAPEPVRAVGPSHLTIYRGTTAERHTLSGR
ncbi:Flp pilus assembly protein CpaB [Amorphus coralli]|uniref:Flp pilus assembly protein CpaB n=1 Tax=Amorphus coralli TaxID=340680 RepID=UPI0003652F80|nr:Flp pilus assembly protein CpaB [Amorphus coralli]